MKDVLAEDKPSGLKPSSRYFFRTRKREDINDKEEEHQAKRVRAMLALLALEVEPSEAEPEEEDEPPEFTLVAMP